MRHLPDRDLNVAGRPVGRAGAAPSRRAGRRLLAGVTTVAVGALVTGCVIVEPGRGGMAVRNESGVDLQILNGDAEIQRVPVRAERAVPLGLAGECKEWTLAAVGPDGEVLDSFGPPVCDEDVWVIDVQGAGEVSGG